MSVNDKLPAVKEALEGLDVQYIKHYGDEEEENMARVNGHSIIWHSGAYCWDEPNTVEVMFPDGDVDGHCPISGLRDLVV